MTNTTDRIVECTMVVDGMTRTYLRVHPGKAYREDFGANRSIQLVCMRAKQDVYGPLTFGVDYQFVRDGDRVAVAAAP
ncbi:hypothetical protein [Phenylobacterium sp.]|uniref:hypothetical protein n=1 Tax=Phenylobacterium sp. TaxID=1871053 RepID=UPI002E2EE871|nr:hypothetical protein [Phenylobacterium sp.]HEX3363648.1 hypothetical protein [Phenylobacterium sp.]